MRKALVISDSIVLNLFEEETGYKVSWRGGGKTFNLELDGAFQNEGDWMYLFSFDELDEDTRLENLILKDDVKYACLSELIYFLIKRGKLPKEDILIVS